MITYDKIYGEYGEYKTATGGGGGNQVLETKNEPQKYALVEKETKQEAGKRYDVGKLRYDLLPVDAIRELVKVYTKGAEKYADRNWEKGMSWSRVVGPLMRHLEKFRQGEQYDAETGCHHMAMVAWNALALVSYDLRNVGTNDLGWELYNSPKEVKGNNNESTSGTICT